MKKVFFAAGIAVFSCFISTSVKAQQVDTREVERNQQVTKEINDNKTSSEIADHIAPGVKDVRDRITERNADYERNMKEISGGKGESAPVQGGHIDADKGRERNHTGGDRN